MGFFLVKNMFYIYVLHLFWSSSLGCIELCYEWIFWFSFVFAVLGIEPRALCILWHFWRKLSILMPLMPAQFLEKHHYLLQQAFCMILESAMIKNWRYRMKHLFTFYLLYFPLENGVCSQKFSCVLPGPAAPWTQLNT